MGADLVLCNAKVLNFASAGEVAEVVGIEGNRIVYVGSRDGLGDLKGPRTRVLDCGRGAVIPGFNDAHCHPLAYAVTRRYVDCSPAKVACIPDILSALRVRVQQTRGDDARSGEASGAGWVRAANYDVSALAEKRPPTRWELDAAVPDHPVVLVEGSGQHCVLNSVALSRCGVPDPPAGSRTGSPRDSAVPLSDGLISGNDEVIARAIPPLSEFELEAGVREASSEYLAHGITSLQDTSWSNGYRHWAAMTALKQAGALAPRVTLLAGLDEIGSFSEQGMRTGSGDDRLRLGGVKIALDESTGDPQPPQEELNEAVLRGHQAGFQLALHVSDVEMLEGSLQALEYLRMVSSFPKGGLRPRLEHCAVCPPELMPRVARSGAMVVGQPNLLHLFDWEYIEAGGITGVLPFRSLMTHGVDLAFSSDSPLTPMDPLQAIQTAVTRVGEGGLVHGIGESLGVADAFGSYTYLGACASGDGEKKGSIAVGKLADLVILDSSPLEVAPEELTEIKVMATVIDGSVVWER